MRTLRLGFPKLRLDSPRSIATYFPSFKAGLRRGQTAAPFPGDWQSMLQAAISELTTFRWELADEIEHLTRHGFDRISLWRTKLSDLGVGQARTLLRNSGMRVSSLQWAGGFTGGDGRSFRDSVADALEAIETAAEIDADVLVVHSGCRGGHTRTHAHRLLADALDVLAPAAFSSGVTLAIKPMHPAAATGCDFLADLGHAGRWVRRFDHPAVKLSIDLWQFGHEPEHAPLLADLVPLTAVVQVADRRGLPSAERDRLPPGHGDLRLEPLVMSLLEHGYTGDFEFELVGETVESLGYDHVLRQTRLAADAWSRRVPAGAM